MNDDREFWLQIRRGLGIVSATVRDKHMGDPFWDEFLRGVNIAVRAIEREWKLPHSSIRPIGQPVSTTEPPSLPTLAQSSPEGTGHGV